MNAYGDIIKNSQHYYLSGILIDPAGYLITVTFKALPASNFTSKVLWN